MVQSQPDRGSATDSGNYFSWFADVIALLNHGAVERVGLDSI